MKYEYLDTKNFTLFFRRYKNEPNFISKIIEETKIKFSRNRSKSLKYAKRELLDIIYRLSPLGVDFDVFENVSSFYTSGKIASKEICFDMRRFGYPIISIRKDFKP